MLSLMMVSMNAEAGDVCGHFTKGSKNAQVIPLKGKVFTKISNEDALPCGAMVITHEEPVWVEMADLTQFKIAPDSFFEFGRKDVLTHKLYRGVVMVSAPPSIKEFELVTPNSLANFHGGVVLMTYDSKNKESTLASFNRKIEFKNKFHSEAVQVVNAGEMSRLWIGDSKIKPTQPEVLNPRSVVSAFQGIAIPEDELKELKSIAERAEDSRSKALVADLESWEDLERESSHPVERTVASMPGKNKKLESSIDPVEANVGLSLLKKHLFGDEQDQKIFEESRSPASFKGAEKLKDTEYQRKKAKENSKVKKVLDDIKNFDPEND